MEKLKFRVYLKNIRGLNKHHFDTHGRMYEVLMIDWENEEVRVRTPSELIFSFKDIELMQWVGFNDKKGREVYEDDIILRKYTVDTGLLDPYISKYKCNIFVESMEWFLRFYGQDISERPFFNKELEIIGNKWENPEMMKNE